MKAIGEAIRQRVERARAEGTELPRRPDVGEMIAACDGNGYEALFWTLFYMLERDGAPRRVGSRPSNGRRKRRARGTYHRWTEAEDRRVLNLDLSPSTLAAEIGVTASAVSTRRSYLRNSPYAPRVAA